MSIVLLILKILLFVYLSSWREKVWIFIFWGCNLLFIISFMSINSVLSVYQVKGLNFWFLKYMSLKMSLRNTWKRLKGVKILSCKFCTYDSISIYKRWILLYLQVLILYDTLTKTIMSKIICIYGLSENLRIKIYIRENN